MKGKSAKEKGKNGSINKKWKMKLKIGNKNEEMQEEREVERKAKDELTKETSARKWKGGGKKKEEGKKVVERKGRWKRRHKMKIRKIRNERREESRKTMKNRWC